MALSSLSRLRQFSLGIRQVLRAQHQPVRFTGNESMPIEQPMEDYLNVRINTKDNMTHIEGFLVSTGREKTLIKTGPSNACVLCRLNLKNLDYTDVMILSQWVKRDGSIATFEESKLCVKQYRKLIKMIGQAQRCNLLARPADYFVPGPWHDLNTYLEPDRKRDQPMKVIQRQYWKT